MKEQSIEFSFQARYLQSGPVEKSTREIWFVLHGYGQLATYFSKKFEALTAHRVVIAPEGLSRFYLEDVRQRASGLPSRVGASWMTREGRLTDIENYLTYLNSVYRQVVPTDFAGPISILGFSQGAATAARWAVSNQIRFERLILWAGIFPDDLDFASGHAVLAKKQTVLVRGTNDPFITEERLAHSQKLIDQLQITPETITFDGGHEIDIEVLQKLSTPTSK
jgi:predicted esterase